MTMKEDIVAAIRSYVGTPFHHQGRVAGEDGGLDCMGAIALALVDAGRTFVDEVDYPRSPNGRLLAELSERFLSIDVEDAVSGDLIIFSAQSSAHPWHGAILDGTEIVHASATARAVVAEDYTTDWQDRALAAYDVTQEP